MKRRRSRRLKAIAPQPRKPLTQASPAQANRVRIMREKGVDLTTIALSLQADGVVISRQAVSDVVTRGRYMDVPRTNRSRSSLIAEKFCNLTGTTLREAWPDLLHEGDDESDPTVINRINRARGVAAGDAGDERDRDRDRDRERSDTSAGA